MIADFRDYDDYGNEIKYEPENIDIQDGVEMYSGVMALGYQGDVGGIQTCNFEKVGNIFEHGKDYGFSEEHIKAFTPSYPR